MIKKGTRVWAIADSEEGGDLFKAGDSGTVLGDLIAGGRWVRWDVPRYKDGVWFAKTENLAPIGVYRVAQRATDGAKTDRRPATIANPAGHVVLTVAMHGCAATCNSLAEEIVERLNS